MVSEKDALDLVTLWYDHHLKVLSNNKELLRKKRLEIIHEEKRNSRSRAGSPMNSVLSSPLNWSWRGSSDEEVKYR